MSQPRIVEITESTPIPLRLVIGIASAVLVLGGAYYSGKVRAEAVEQRVVALEDEARERAEKQAATNADLDKRVALVERAVLSLEKIASEMRRQ